MGVVDVELWAMLISPERLQQSPTHSLDRETFGGNTGSSYPFRSALRYEPKPIIRGPTLTGLGQDSNHVKIPVSYLGPSATAMPLIGGPAH